MRNPYITSPLIGKTLFASLIVMGVLLLTPKQANAQEEGNYCVWDYMNGAVCTANDVRIKELRIVEVVKPCYLEPVGYLDVVFEALVSSEGSPNRYDIGLFLATDGGSALSGNSCYHDFLPPPITISPVYADKNGDGVRDIDNGPWWNGEPGIADTCGDIETNSQVFRTILPIRIACTDLDQNGAADIHVCTSWDNQVDNNCNAVQQAAPGTKSKCGCTVINFDFTPTAIQEIAFTAKSEASPPKLGMTALGLIMVCGLFAGYFHHRGYTDKLSG